ncbi:MAG TPA: ester cyclase [Candidatus Dormibacteraeota bacterium]
MSNEAAFRRLIDEGFSQRRLEVVDELVAEDAREHQRGLKPGREGVKETINTLHTWFSDFRVEVADVAEAGGLVWARNVATGVNTGSIMGRPPTGRSMRIDVFDTVRFRDGKLVEHWGVPDQLGMLLQLGLMPGRPA